MMGFACHVSRSSRLGSPARVTLCALGFISLVALGGCGGGVRPYRAMAKAAASEESVGAQADDKRLTLRVREALLHADAAAAGRIAPHVYMDRVFLVGFVESEEERSLVEAAARGVEGVREVDGYLPVESADAASWTTKTMNDAEIKTELAAALAADLRTAKLRVDTSVLAGHILLLGVVGSESEREDAVRVAANIAGADRVTSFLLLPDPNYEKPLRQLLRDR
jgi:hyperosmotically inducible periplasmic protein